MKIENALSIIFVGEFDVRLAVERATIDGAHVHFLYKRQRPHAKREEVNALAVLASVTFCTDNRANLIARRRKRKVTTLARLDRTRDIELQNVHTCIFVPPVPQWISTRLKKSERPCCACKWNIPSVQPCERCVHWRVHTCCQKETTKGDTSASRTRTSGHLSPETYALH